VSSFRYGDSNYARSGLVGTPRHVYDVFLFALGDNKYLIYEEDFWDEYCEEDDEFIYDIEGIQFSVIGGKGGFVRVYEDINKFYEEVEEVESW
jgi:hypothetical protein